MLAVLGQGMTLFLICGWCRNLNLTLILFFVLFQHVAGVRRWSDSARVLLLLCVLTGRAQEAYSAICVEARLDYEMKSAVLKAYELVPEAYRQKFCNSNPKQTLHWFVCHL